MTIDTLFPINFSSTMMDDISKCEFYWFRKHCQKLTGEIRNGDLIAGGHIASACEITRKAYYNEGVDEEDAIDLGVNYILTSEDTTHELKTNERVALCFRKYFQKYRLSSNLQPVKLVDGTFAIEYLFAFDLGIAHPEIPGVNLVYKGKLDGLYDEVIGGARIVSVVDEKSTASIPRCKDKSPDWILEENNYNSSGQFLGYHMAARKLGVKTHNTKIRRIPIMATFEPSYELNIEVSSFAIDNWERMMFAKINELVEKYKWFKAKGELPQKAFYQKFDESCNKFKKPCIYKIGCLDPKGEIELAMKYKQQVYDSTTKEVISLQDYKNKHILQEMVNV